ncbi:MAG: hypothetical protein LAO21_12540 [Acidobacteriia bacterium]|nr:hypothetical protein [Terriglobia bacterium]
MDMIFCIDSSGRILEVKRLINSLLVDPATIEERLDAYYSGLMEECKGEFKRESTIGSWRLHWRFYGLCSSASRR